MKILVLGANGQLGSDICDVFRKTHEVFAAVHEDGDIENKDAMRSLIEKEQPDCIINTAAMHNVEACEKEPEKAYRINALGAKNLAELCAEDNLHLIHISTDYVFNGKKDSPYTEDDTPGPLNVYGNTKLAGENYALETWGRTSIVRVGGLYGKNPCRAKNGLNFVQLMLKLAAERPDIKVVDNEIVTPTPTYAIAEQLLKIVENDLNGIIHATCQGQCSWYDFAKTIFDLNSIRANLVKAKPCDFPAKVNRPMYSVLANHRLQKYNLDLMPDWQQGLKNYLRAETC